MIDLCPPAIIYLIFSISQILIDTFKGMYNTALMKMVVTILITFLLQILCERGLNIISWIIVFIPFILMSVIVTMLLFLFGLNPKTGNINYDCPNNNNVHTDSQGNIIIYDPYYNANQHPVYYQSPNIIVPKPSSSMSSS
jgi:ABC-type sugar transport system permease subunit